ncbi:MAG: sugar phosphate isomerase/epimerase family protein [Thermoproteota archaeon]|jgi:sugar phosphate isomerase/epimerase
MKCLISVSSAPVAKLGDKEYYDLIGTIDVMKKIFSKSVVNGFELQLEPEWDSNNPPLTDKDLADWTKTPKYTAEEILNILKRESLPILSVHASRDVGSYLCSNRKCDWEKGKQVIYDALFIASELGASVCVFHLWDTWATSFDLNHIQETFHEITRQFPNVKASVENIPTHLKGYTPFALVKLFDYITLDLRWVALYDELDTFKLIIDKIVNVHLRGKLRDNKWILDQSSFGFYEALNKIKNNWRYRGLLTMEPDGRLNSSCFHNFIEAMKTLQTM